MEEKIVFTGIEAVYVSYNLALYNYRPNRIEVIYTDFSGFCLKIVSGGRSVWISLGASFEHLGWAEIFRAARTTPQKYMLG